MGNPIQWGSSLNGLEADRKYITKPFNRQPFYAIDTDKYYRWNDDTNQWDSVPKTEELITAAIDTHSASPDAHHSQEHSHPTHSDINFTGTVSADGDAGLTGQRTVGGYKFTFKKGLLVGFEPV